MRLRVLAFWLSVIFIFIIPWESGAVIDGVGPIARPVGLLVIGFWLGVVVMTGRIRSLRPFHLVVLLFLFWNILSLFWSVNITQTLSRLETYVQLTILVFLIWDLYTRPNRVRIGMQAYVFGAYITISSVISNYLNGITTGRGRYTGFDFNENGLAMTLVIGMGIAWYLAVYSSTEDQRKLSWVNLIRLANYLFVPLAIFCILLTASRTALITTVPFLWFMLASTTKIKLTSRIFLMISMVAALFIVQPLVPQTSIERLSTTSSELTEGDLNGRQQLWEKGIETFLENPVVGVGSGTFKTITDGQVAHNTYLSILTEIGFIGFLIFAAMTGIALYQIKNQNKLLAALWLTVFLSWAIGISSMSWEQRKPTWFIIAFVVVSGQVILEHRTMKESITNASTLELSHPTSN